MGKGAGLAIPELSGAEEGTCPVVLITAALGDRPPPCHHHRRAVNELGGGAEWNEGEGFSVNPSHFLPFGPLADAPVVLTATARSGWPTAVPRR